MTIPRHLFTTAILFLCGAALAFAGTRAPATPPPANPLVQQKAEAIIIPLINMKDAELSDCVDFLRKKSEEFDPNPPNRRGVGFIVRVKGNHKITLHAKNRSVWDLTKMIAASAGAEVTVENHKIVIRAVPVK
jgi:hypothetical protein